MAEHEQHLHPISADGVLTFARFAYPPNALSLCGPDHADELFERTSAGVVDQDLRQISRGFEGAWPYLELIAGASRRADPLEHAVVDSYWIGGPLADRVPTRLLAAMVHDRFRIRAGSHHEALQRAVAAGLAPTHAFHVFVVYPWTGLLREGHTSPSLRILDSCRIRWGEVLEVDGDRALVESNQLMIRLGGIELAAPTVEEVRIGRNGQTLLAGVQAGSCVAIHWDWICDQLDRRRLHLLQRNTFRCLEVVNGFLHDRDPDWSERFEPVLS
ncbi:MAG: DUF6390 family protein [Acidimicrobiales bacterium]|nr:DUF6390 family protein [Acidimicrobiales bacterium]